jgi:hypothetical protein
VADNDQNDGLAVGIGPSVTPDYLRPVYANVVNVNHTPWDFRLIFALARAPAPGPETEAAKAAGNLIQPETVAEILIPANLIHGLISALQANFEKYLDAFGVPGMNPEGPGSDE